MSDETKPEPRRLAGAPLDLRAPKSLAEVWDIAKAGQRDGCEDRAYALALGLCWPRFRIRYPFGGDPLAYAGRVIDVLLGEGATYWEIMTAGQEATALALTKLVVVVPDTSPFSPTPTVPAGPTNE